MKWEVVVGDWRRAAGMVSCAVGAAVGVGVLSVWVGLHWGGAGGVAVAAVLAGGVGVVYERLRWQQGVRELIAMTELARTGEAAVDAVARVGGRVRAFSEEAAEILRDVKRQRLELATLEDELRQRVRNRTDALEREVGALRAKAHRDGLTGLLNRRALDETLPDLVEGALRSRDDLCVLMMDVDHFKQLNDTRGHAAGDDFLRSLAQLIKSSIGPDHLAFRHGGDEFVVAMPRATRADAAAVGDRVRSLVDAFVKPMRCQNPPRVSVGVAALADTPEKTVHALMKAADKALYTAKGDRRRRAA